MKTASSHPKRLLAGTTRVSRAAFPLPHDLRGKLTALARRHLLLNLGEGAAFWLGIFSTLFLVQALADWWLNLPLAVRVIFLLMDICLLGWLGWSRLYRPWQKRIYLPGAALLAQKQFPLLRGALIASVQLADSRTGSTHGSPALVKALITETAHSVRLLDFRKAASARNFRRQACWSLIPITAALALAVWAWPASGVLVARILLFPIPLPTKTIVIAVTKDLSVPVGSDVELSARAAGIVPRQGRVKVTYADGQVQEIPVTLSTSAKDMFSLSLKNVQRGFRYQFSLNDGRGEVFTVRPMDAPAIASLGCQQIWPSYTGLGEQKRDPAILSLLAGSTLKLKVQSTLPIKLAMLHLEGLDSKVEMKVTSPDRKTAEGEIPVVPGLTGFSIALVSDENVASVKDSIYPIEVLRDEAPTLSIVSPLDQTGSVTLSTKARIEFEVGDDYGLTNLALCYRIVAPPVPGAQDAQPSAEVHRREFSLKDIGYEPGRLVRVNDVWDLSSEKPRWQEGWKVTWWLEASDNNSATGPSVTRTGEREWTIVSPEAKRAELDERLKQDADTLKELSSRQENASKEVGNLLETQTPVKP